MLSDTLDIHRLGKTERLFRLLFGVALVGIAINVGLTSPATEAKVVAWGALVLAAVSFASLSSGAANALARVGLDQNWSLAYLTARLFVGWEFLYAGWDKATNNWFHGAGSDEVKGFLGGAVGQSHATSANAFPAVSHWFAWTADNVFLSHSEVISYLVVGAELCVGIGLILGLFLRLSALVGVTLNALFLFSGSLSAGLNPEMIILGMVVLFGAAPAVYALTVDRYYLPRLHTIRLRKPPIVAPSGAAVE